MQVYVITSDKSLSTIAESLPSESDPESYRLSVMYARKNPSIKPVQTNKTLFFTSQPILVESIKNGGFKVEDYNWNTFKRTDRTSGDTDNLQFSNFPKNMFESDVNRIIQTRLDFLKKNEVKGDWAVTVWLDDRETGAASGSGIISFTENTPMETRNLTKLLLHNMRIHLDASESANIKCMWRTTNKKFRQKETKSSLGTVGSLATGVKLPQKAGAARWRLKSNTGNDYVVEPSGDLEKFLLAKRNGKK
jgi:hypothetical protein